MLYLLLAVVLQVVLSSSSSSLLLDEHCFSASFLRDVHALLLLLLATS